MPETLTPEPPVLFLDAASPFVRAGVQVDSAPESAIWHQSPDEAGVGLFQIIEDLLRDKKLQLNNIRTIAFCEGPGSLLGIRLAAIALRTWEAVSPASPPRLLAYRSLELVAARLLQRGVRPPFAVISDARRQTWNVLEVDADGRWADLARQPASALRERPVLYYPAEFPHWQELPQQACAADYRPVDLPQLARRFPLLREAKSPDAFLVEAPTYRPWSPAS